MTDLNSQLQIANRAQATGTPVAAQDWLTRREAAIGDRLPGGPAGAKRYTKLLFSVMQRTPQLMECFQTAKGRDSLGIAVDQMAQLGLEPGPQGHCYFLPFRNTKERYMECTYILGYKGMVQLAYMHPDVVEVKARPVFEGDHFEWWYGLDEDIHHQPRLEGKYEDRQLTHVYAWAKTVRGGRHFIVLDRSEVEFYMHKSRGWEYPNSPWKQFFPVMARKTALRRLMPEIPMASTAAEEIAKDEEREMPYGNSAKVPFMGGVEPSEGLEVPASQAPPEPQGEASQEQAEDAGLPIVNKE